MLKTLIFSVGLLSLSSVADDKPPDDFVIVEGVDDAVLLDDAPLPDLPPPNENCKALELGGKRIVDLDDQLSETGVEAKYTLTRTEAFRYIADINLDFSAGAEYTRNNELERGSLTDQMVDSIYRARVQQCLQDFKGLLRDRNGTVVDIRINEKSGERTYSETSAVTIAIAGTDHRSSSGEYASNIECHVVIHELMHLMGLVDEYSESDSQQSSSLLDPNKVEEMGLDPAKAAAGNCRAAGLSTSGMYSPYNFKPPPNTTNYKILVCKCTSGSYEKCQKIFKGNEKSCPTGTKKVATDMQIQLIDGEFPKLMAEMKGNKEVGIVLEAKKVDPSEMYLIPPLEHTHMNVILYPGCWGKNQLYYLCAENAYRTSVDRGGEGCRKVPKECQTDRWLTGKGVRGSRYRYPKPQGF